VTVTDTLVDWSLGGHIAIAVAALSFYKFILVEISKDIIKNAKIISKKIEENIFAELSITLKPLLEEEQGKAIIITGQWSDGLEGYKEKPAELQGSERYKNALYDFINSNANSMADFRNLTLFTDKCLFWKRYLKYSAYILVGFNFVAAMFEVYCRIYNVCSNNKMVIMGLLFLSFILIANCFCSLWPLNLYQDKVEDYERKYA